MNAEKTPLQTLMCGEEEDSNPTVQQIGGFNHITNLDVYRKEIHQKFLLNLVGEYV